MAHSVVRTERGCCSTVVTAKATSSAVSQSANRGSFSTRPVPMANSVADAGRADGRDADALLAQLAVEGAGEADLGELRARVDRLVAAAAQAGHR